MDYEYEAYKILRLLKNEYDDASYKINKSIYVEIVNDYYDAYKLFGFHERFIYNEYKMNLCKPISRKTMIEICFMWGDNYEDVWLTKIMGQSQCNENEILSALTIILENNIRVIIK